MLTIQLSHINRVIITVTSYTVLPDLGSIPTMCKHPHLRAWLYTHRGYLVPFSTLNHSWYILCRSSQTFMAYNDILESEIPGQAVVLIHKFIMTTFSLWAINIYLSRFIPNLVCICLGSDHPYESKETCQ